MRLMRKHVARILDQSPALELLRNSGGEVVGARGVRRQHGDAWTVHGGTVVVASRSAEAAAAHLHDIGFNVAYSDEGEEPDEPADTRVSPEQGRAA
jgi:hypothetical protein